MINKKMSTCRIVNVAVPADCTVTLKKKKGRPRYKTEKKWNMNMTVIPTEHLEQSPYGWQKDLKNWK